AALFWQIADAVLRVERRRAAEHFHRSRIRKQDRHDQPDGRRLAGAVRTDESVQRAARYFEVETMERRHGAERLPDARETNRRVLIRHIQRVPDAFCSLPPGADSIILTSVSVTFGSRPSVCPFSSRTTSATTRPSLQPGYVKTFAVPGRGRSPYAGFGGFCRDRS